MAEVVLGALAEHLVSEALSLAAEEFSLILHYKEDLESLATELKLIQALLADADNKNNRSVTMRLWLERFKDVATDAEDVLEEYKYELLRRKLYVPQTKWDKVRHFFSPMRKLAFRFKIGHKIKDINKKLVKIAKSGTRYGLKPILQNATFEVNPNLLTGPFVKEEEIVGRDDDFKKVVDMLVNVDSEKNFAVIGIVGMAGAGKTALAQLVYKNEKVVKHFQHRMWVCVSEDFQVERILNEMVQSITQTNPNLINREALIKKLQEQLKDRRYLLVLDDVWDKEPEKWESMKQSLQAIGVHRGNKVIVTTRNDEVLTIMRASKTHPLDLLSEADSWTLFEQTAFAEGGARKIKEFEEIGQMMVKRCGRVPLAIKVLGGLLYSKNQLIDWMNIEKSDVWSLPGNESVMASIMLSYDHLPSVSLKQCFAYCSIFPKDTKMIREDLIELWMAQGFLNPPEGSASQMEDLGNDFFNILMRNCLLQEPTYDGYNDYIESCKMHDVVHDFAVSISKGYCITKKVGKDQDDIKGVHLSLISDEGEMINMSQEISPKLRTLYIPRGQIMKNVFLSFKCLRTLILGDQKIENLPNSIGRLKLLRYINLERAYISALPVSFSKLYNLQTLRIWLKESETIFLGTLINLRHIYTGGERGGACKLVGIKHLTHLQTLSHFTVSDNCKIEDLGPLNNLRGRLSVYGLDKVKNGDEAQKANISGKPNLEHLILNWKEDREAGLSDEDILENLRPHSYLKRLKIKYFMASKFPSWMTTRSDTLLHNLVEISLYHCDFLEQLPPLGHLPHLEKVEISFLNNVKRIGAEFYGCTTSNYAFPALTRLKLSYLNNVEEWIGVEHPSMSSSSVSTVSFPLLKELTIECFRSLINLQSLQGLSSLEELTISSCGCLTNLPSLQGLSSLKNLKIETLQNFGASLLLPDLSSLETSRPALLHGLGLEHLPSLEYLDIGQFSVGLDYFPWPYETAEDGDNAQLYFASLKGLVLRGWPKLTSLPDQIQLLPSLKSLFIYKFEGLKALPEWLGNIQSLQVLHIWQCKNLEYMPSTQAMQRLTNLQSLYILFCPHLEERCNRSGPEWDKIARIPLININGKNIQSPN